MAPITAGSNNQHPVSEDSFLAEEVAAGFDIVWSLEFLSPALVILAQKDGKIFLLDLKRKTRILVPGGPVANVHGQGGLMDLALHPEFKKNKILYFSYTKKVKSDYTTAIAIGKLDNKNIVELKDIFVANNSSQAREHFGSRIAFDDKGHLFFGVGDRGSRHLAQDLTADQGKIHRLKLDGSIPADNPFLQTKNARKAIWTYGHRNPQGLVYDTQKKILFENEHGPRGGDEINIIYGGKNYGWPIITFGREYYGPSIGEGTKKVGMEQPLYYFVPSIAPSSLEIYSHSRFSNWRGNLFSGALVLTHVNRVDQNNKKQIKEYRYLESLGERIRDIKQDPDGYLYFSTDSGKIMRLISRDATGS